MKYERDRRRHLRQLIAELYEIDPVGCCMHVVTDDQNYDQKSIDLCLRQALERGHGRCQVIAAEYMATPRDRRWEILRVRAPR